MKLSAFVLLLFVLFTLVLVGCGADEKPKLPSSDEDVVGEDPIDTTEEYIEAGTDVELGEMI